MLTHMGGVSGSACAAEEGLVGVGDRPAPGPGPQDSPRVPERRAGAGPAAAGRAGPFEGFAAYCRIRFADDPHLFATALFEEVGELGYDGSTLTRRVSNSR
jgi:hypothetical protein